MAGVGLQVGFVETWDRFTAAEISIGALLDGFRVG